MHMMVHDPGHDLPLDPIFSDSSSWTYTNMFKFDWNLPSKKEVNFIPQHLLKMSGNCF